MSAELPPGEEIAGESSQMRRPSPWFEAEDVLEAGGRMVLTIDCVKRYASITFADGSVEEGMHAIHWLDCDKPLLLRPTNRKRIVAQWGKKVDAWKGRRLALFTVRTTNPKTGEPCPGTRVRPITEAL